MSTSVNAGATISKAVKVLQESYKNIHILLADLDRIGAKEGFISLTPKFLRYRSEGDPESWATHNFIKLYRKADSGEPEKSQSVGFVYGVEIDLIGENDEATLSLHKFEFDFSYWDRLPSTTDHWVFWWPFRESNHFEIQIPNQTEDLWVTKTKDGFIKKYWGLQGAVASEMPLTNLSSSEDISEKVFKRFLLM